MNAPYDRLEFSGSSSQNFSVASLIFGDAKFAKKWICTEKSGNYKERKIRGKNSQFASVWIYNEWNYPRNQKMYVARNGICKVM